MSDNNKDNIATLISDVKTKLTLIFVFQNIMIFITLLLILLINIQETWQIPLQLGTVVNAALFGYLGTLVFFSRKCYVYLITKKLTKSLKESINSNQDSVNDLLSVIRGYYLYLLFRPMVGLVIGPLLFMFVVTGLVTFMKTSVEVNTEISRSGRYLIYIVSFLGGHASSDLLDRFSTMAKQIVLRKGE